MNEEEDDEVEYSESDEDDDEGDGGLPPSINALRLRFILIFTPAFFNYITMNKDKRNFRTYPSLCNFLSFGVPPILANANKTLNRDEVHPHTLIF